MEDKKFAILIDADNIGSQYIKVIIDETAKEGIITYKRIYGVGQSQIFLHGKKCY